MCLLSYYPPGVQPDLERLRNGADMNPHGFGYCIVKPWYQHKDGIRPGRLITGKSMQAPALIEEFGKLREENPEGAALFHSRFATSGLRNETNCHPFYVGKDKLTVVAHNGVLFGKQDGETRSDTHIFADEVMPVLFRRLNREGVIYQLHRYVGAHNKLVILSANPRYSRQSWIINERSGTWTREEWQSNWDYISTRRSRKKKSGKEPPGVIDDWLADVPVPVPADYCFACETGGSVDKYGTCTVCGTCSECYEPDGRCLCYAPGKNHR